MVRKLFLKTFRIGNKNHLSKREMYGFHGTIRGTLFCSRVMGLLPLTGLTSPSSRQLRFTLCSPYTILYTFSLFGQVLMFIMTFNWLIQNGISLPNITNTVFYTSSLLSFLILTHIGRSWPSLVSRVEAIECKLPPFTRDVRAKANITTIFILTAATVEHLLSVFYGMKVACACDINIIGEKYFQFDMPWIFEFTPYSLWKGVLTKIFNVQSTFIWSLNDVLIMVISIYLTEHLLIHNELLKKAAEQEQFSCQEFRTQYLKIVRLVRVINGQFGIYILTSFGSNLYWICTQLFYSLSRTQTGHFITCTIKNSEGANVVPATEYQYHPLCMWMLSDQRILNGVEHSIYFTYSFSFLVLRTLLVLLLAARIHSNSVAPLNVLFGIPSSKYHIEVERYIAQINNIKVAISGLDFFYVTRAMILTLLGTIVTYELVLLQFNR